MRAGGPRLWPLTVSSEDFGAGIAAPGGAHSGAGRVEWGSGGTGSQKRGPRANRLVASGGAAVGEPKAQKCQEQIAKSFVSETPVKR